MSWKMIWYDIISDERTNQPFKDQGNKLGRMQRSIGMVENHKVQFSYVGFVDWQILGIVGSQIEVEKVFNIINICTNLQCFHLGHG
jgi:hypothetical protein